VPPIQLQSWARTVDGWIVFECSGGFRLADGSVRSPDVSLVRLDRWRALSEAEREGFPPLCPDLVVELASPSAQLEPWRQKMVPYISSAP
jgi:Uma2 family endonuclease